MQRSMTKSNKTGSEMVTGANGLDELHEEIMRLEAECRLTSIKLIELAEQKERLEEQQQAAEQEREELQRRQQELEEQISGLQVCITAEQKDGFPDLERKLTQLRVAVTRREQKLNSLGIEEENRQAKQRSTPLPGKGAKFDL